MYGGDKDKEVIKQKTKITRKEGSSSSPQGQRTIKEKRKVKIVRERSSSSSSSQRERNKMTNVQTTGQNVTGPTAYTTTGYTAYETTGLNTGLTGPGSGLNEGHMHPTSTETTEKKGFVEKIKSKLPGHHNN